MESTFDDDQRVGRVTERVVHVGLRLADEVSRQLKKGVLDILLLKLLEGQTLYGYELMSLLDRESKGYFSLKEGTLYPVLYRLEDAGRITSFGE